MKGWGSKGLLIGAVAAALIGVAAVAMAAARSPETGRAATMKGAFAAAGGEVRGERAWEGRGCGGAGGKMGELMGDEEFRADVFALRQEHFDDVKALWDDYGDAPTSDAAREAMQKLREEHRTEMQRLLEKYGVEWDGPQVRGAGRGAGCGAFMGGGAGLGGGMMSPGGGMMRPDGPGGGTSGSGASAGGMMGAGGYSL